MAEHKQSFRTVIKEILPLIGEVDKSTQFVILRNKSGGWQLSYPHHTDSINSFLAMLKKIDQYAVSFCGADFDNVSFLYVYNKVLCGRLKAGLRKGTSSGDYTVWTDRKEAVAMLNFYEENTDEFSQRLKDYLTTVDNPLAALAEMCPYKMATDNDEWAFNEDLAFDAIHYIENEATIRLQSYPDAKCKPDDTPENNRYKEKQRVQIGQAFIILAEKADAESPYIVCNRINGEEYDKSDFSDYISAMRELITRLETIVESLEAERKIRKEKGVDSTVLSASHCLPDSENADLTGKTVIVKASALSDEYRYSDSQILLCTHGSGAPPEKNDRTVFGTELYSGDIVCYGRYQIEGVAAEALLPQWAKTKLEIKRNKEIFEYCGYHFKPVRQFRDSEINKPLDTDSRPWKNDAQYAMRNMASDFSLGISAYNWKKNDAVYSIDTFYAASGGSIADIFKCLENGKLYVPGENELFRYNEPLNGGFEEVWHDNL